MSAGAPDIAGLLRSSLRGVVSSDPEDLKSFAAGNPILAPAAAPALVVRPADVTDLKDLIGLAGKHGIGLVPVSSQAPHIKGGINCAGRHLIVDLSAWKNQCEFNRRNRVCAIDPGITYGQLRDVLLPHGLTISMPLAPRSGKSVLAAVMDREPSTWPNKQWDIADPVGSTEFIFGTGDIFRTGAAGGPGSIEAQRKVGGARKSPLGPSQTDFHRVVQGSQGSMGIVAWITVRVELKPSIEEPRLLGAESLPKLIPFVYEVQRPWLGEQCFILDRFAAALLMTAGGAGAGGTSVQSLPEFVCLINVAGFERLPRERVAYQQKDIEDISSRHGLSPAEAVGGLSARDLLKKASSPCGRDDFRHSLRGHCLSIFFLSTLDRAPAMIEVFEQTAAKHGLARDRFGVYIQPVVQNHGCHIELMTPFDPGEEVELMRRFEKEAVTTLAAAGAFFSRPYGTAAAVAFARNPLNTAVLKKVKSIFDPNRILSPGRFGL